MLDEANSQFVNHIVTAIRYGLYVVGAVIILGILWFGVMWLSETFGGGARSSDASYIARARQRMRDLGYK
jgi:hypothetical protein